MLLIGGVVPMLRMSVMAGCDCAMPSGDDASDKKSTNHHDEHGATVGFKTAYNAFVAAK